MLGYLTTDAAVDPAAVAPRARGGCRYTFNAITVDGESSTNDCVFAMASGAQRCSHRRGALPRARSKACARSHTISSLGIVRGGEGATKLIAITVSGARSQDEAWTAARVIANSPLVKTAVHGGDPNWGRLVAAAGRSGVTFSLEAAAVRIGSLVLFSQRPAARRAGAAGRRLPARQGHRDRSQCRRRRQRPRHDLHVRSLRRVRQDQRRIPDLELHGRVDANA